MSKNKRELLKEAVEAFADCHPRADKAPKVLRTILQRQFSGETEKTELNQREIVEDVWEKGPTPNVLQRYRSMKRSLRKSYLPEAGALARDDQGKPLGLKLTQRNVLELIEVKEAESSKLEAATDELKNLGIKTLYKSRESPGYSEAAINLAKETDEGEVIRYKSMTGSLLRYNSFVVDALGQAIEQGANFHMLIPDPEPNSLGREFVRQREIIQGSENLVQRIRHTLEVKVHTLLKYTSKDATGSVNVRFYNVMPEEMIFMTDRGGIVLPYSNKSGRSYPAFHCVADSRYFRLYSEEFDHMWDFKATGHEEMKTRSFPEEPLNTKTLHKYLTELVKKTAE